MDAFRTLLDFPKDRRLALALKLLLWAVALGGVWRTVGNAFVAQWDYKLYLSCANAMALGIDPYDSQKIAEGLGYQWGMPCIYPPLVITAYRPLVRISPG